MFPVCAKHLFCFNKPHKNSLFLFPFFLQESFTVGLHRRVPDDAASHVRFGIFCTHFFDVAKNTSSERNHIRYPYTSGSEKPSKKLFIFRNWVPEGRGEWGQMGWDGMGWDGMGCDAMGCERMGWTGMGWHGMR